MRQGGFKPKNHNSGVYWIRANAGTSNQNTEKDNSLSILGDVVTCIIITLFIVCAFVA